MEKKNFFPFIFISDFLMKIQHKNPLVNISTPIFKKTFFYLFFADSNIVKFDPTFMIKSITTLKLAHNFCTSPKEKEIYIYFVLLQFDC